MNVYLKTKFKKIKNLLSKPSNLTLMQMGSEKVKLLNVHVQHAHMRMLRFGFLNARTFYRILKNQCLLLCHLKKDSKISPKQNVFQ